MDTFRTLFFRYRKPVVVIVAFGFLFAMAKRHINPTDRLPEGMAVPGGVMVFIQGGEGRIATKDLLGKGVMFNFWATWCGPCKAEIPALQKLHEQYGGEHFVMVGITSESPNQVRPFLRQAGVTYPILRDPGGRFGDEFQIDTIPFSIFVGPDGRVVGDVTGELDYDSGAERIERLVGLAKTHQESAQKADSE